MLALTVGRAASLSLLSDVGAKPELVEVVGSGFTFGQSTGRDVTFAAAPDEDDIIVLVYTGSGGTAGGAPSSFSWGTGFTEFIAPATAASDSVIVAAAWKRAGASESDTYPATWTAGTDTGNERLFGLRYTGATTSGSPLDDDNAQTFLFAGTSLPMGQVLPAATNTVRTIVVVSNGTLSSPTMVSTTEWVYNEAFGGSDFGMNARALFSDPLTRGGDNKPMIAGSSTFNVYAVTFTIKAAAAGGGGATLAPADMASASTIDNVTLTQTHVLTVADTASSSTLDAVALTQTHTLAVADLASASTIDAVALTQTHTLTVADTASATTVDNVALTQDHQLAVADMASGSTIDNVTLAVDGALIVQDVTSATTIDNVTVVQTHILTVADVTSASALDAVVLTQTHTLSVDGVTSATTIDAVTLSQDSTLAVADLASATTIDSVTLGQTHLLSVADATSTVTIDSVVLYGLAATLTGRLRTRRADTARTTRRSDTPRTTRGDGR